MKGESRPAVTITTPVTCLRDFLSITTLVKLHSLHSHGFRPHTSAYQAASTLQRPHPQSTTEHGKVDMAGPKAEEAPRKRIKLSGETTTSRQGVRSDIDRSLSLRKVQSNNTDPLNLNRANALVSE